MEPVCLGRKGNLGVVDPEARRTQRTCPEHNGKPYESEHHCRVQQSEKANVKISSRAPPLS